MQRSNSQMKWRSYFWNTFVLMELWNSWVDFANPILFCERSPDNNCHFRVTGDFSDIFQPIIMTLFTWSLFSISGVMLIIQVDIVKYSLDFFFKSERLIAVFLTFYFFSSIDFSCIMEALCLYRYWFSVDWLHWLWCSLLVKSVNELSMHSIESILPSIGWTGICFQSN